MGALIPGHLGLSRAIKVSPDLKKYLDEEKLCPDETYNSVLKRLLKVGK